VRVLLVEDHAVVREAMASVFGAQPDFEVVGEAASLAEARAKLEDVDVAVIDLRLPDGDGADLIEVLRAASPEAHALVLSASVDRDDAAKAVQRGAAGVLDKAVHLDEVVDAVRRLRAGETLLSMAEIVELLHVAERRREHEHADREAISQLTPREREVLQLLAEGLDTRQIAERLFISVRTERNHMTSILRKLGVHSQLQALVFALRYNAVELR
jgi:DNA-binding NarL/FixJ family response regulator